MTARRGGPPDDLGTGSSQPPSSEPVPNLTDAQQTRLVEDHWPMMRGLVAHITHGYPPWVDLDDLYGAAGLALVLAAGNFDSRRGLTFAQHATYRVRFALLDNRRHHTWLSRHARQRGNVTPAVLRIDDPDLPADPLLGVPSFEDRLVYVMDGTQALEAGMAALRPRLRMIILALYADERTLQSVATELGVSETRIWQLKVEALRVMRNAAAA